MAPSLHAAEIRFALIGDVGDANVWALFDSQGYSYNNYAVRSAYWPRLYQLSIPGGQFEAQAAAGMPSAMQPESDLFAATVPLRSDLKWTDGAPFTADDVVFTVSTAAAFELGFDWRAYYDPDSIDHVEALDAHTVKFFFKQAPGVAQWQYGALQGPIVQKAYWSPKIAEAMSLLPTAADRSQVKTLNTKVADLQKRIEALIAEGVHATGDQARELQLELKRRQSDLDEAMNDLAKAQAVVDSAVQAGRRALYAVDAGNEPALGMWIPGARQNGAWINQANPAHPFGTPHIDRLAYLFYPDQAAAVTALDKGDVNALLGPGGLSPDLAQHLAAQDTLMRNANASSHFIVINPSRSILSDPVLRRALYCAIDRNALAGGLVAMPLASFVPSTGGPWWSPTGVVSCGDGYDPLAAFDPSKAVAILRAAGYTWASSPAGEQAGVGLRAPDGQAFPAIGLLAPSEQEDPQSNKAALFVQQSVRYLGIPLSVQIVDTAEIRFALFKGGGYDMAIAGWHLSTYPGYLCDWFGPGNPFGYQDDATGPACQALASTSDLVTAETQAARMQGLLAQNPPFIPLYSGLTYDVYRGIRYPFDSMPGGLSAVYGAPGLAIPAPP